VTSDRLYTLGIELMDGAVADAEAAGRIRTAHAFQYRDGLVIAFLALIPLRRRTLVALRIGKHLVKIHDLWALDIPAADTKARRALDYAIPSDMSERIDFYLEQLRKHIPGAHKHTSLWASNQGCPMCGMAIYAAVRRRTKKAFGFAVNLHRFRHAAASFWSSHDPVNVRGAKDLLGHASFDQTEKHYIMGQSRLAGRALAHAIDTLRK
jgi:integrase/recombinase XerD